ncbi:MAG: PAC2 family protein [Candidatus Micrarchaeota archaeon]|nr:PAC2 family protein [Candidatus Micrarchaeota archaeon]
MTGIKLVLLDKKPKYSGYTLVEGFPGYGLVGTIAVNFLVEKFKMELVGYAESQLFPPIVAIHDTVPLPPLRIYKSDKHKLLLVMSEFVMSMKAVHAMADVLYSWCEKNNVRRIVSLGGISISGKQDEVFGITSDPKEIKMFDKYGVLPIKEGATTGINALLLQKAAMGGKVPVVSFLAEAKPDYVDPLGAAMVLTSLSDYLGIQIDTTELVKEAMLIESKLRKNLEAVKKAETTFKETFSAGGMYA